MPRLILLIAVLAVALILWNKITRSSGDERKKLIIWGILGSIITILVLLAVTGHLNFITAAIAALIALLPRAIQMLKYLPYISRMYQQHKNPQGEQQQTPPPQGKKSMTKEEAIEILGLKTGYSKDDVIQAHRRMMQKVHPDRGGSDYLAAQINKAKDTLIG